MDGVDVHLARSGAIRSERLEPFATPRMAVDMPLEHGRVRYETGQPISHFPWIATPVRAAGKQSAPAALVSTPPTR